MTKQNRTVRRIARPCGRCDKRFYPESRGTKICNSCWLEARIKGLKKREELKLKP